MHHFPVPLRFTCALPPSYLIVMMAVWLLAVVGVNVTLIVHLPLPEREVQSAFVSLKSGTSFAEESSLDLSRGLLTVIAKVLLVLFVNSNGTFLPCFSG